MVPKSRTPNQFQSMLLYSWTKDRYSWTKDRAPKTSGRENTTEYKDIACHQLTKLFGEVSAPAQHKIKQLQGILTLFVHDEDFGHEDTVPGSGMKFFFGFRCSPNLFLSGI